MIRHFVALATVTFCLMATLTEATHTIDKAFLEKQQKIFEILWHPDQPKVALPELQKVADAWDFKANLDKFVDKSIVLDFLQRYEHGMLPRGEVFSMNYNVLSKEAIALFHVFHCAKDFDTFYKTAVWARFHVNELQFVYALTVAVLYRPDLKYIRLPAIYEISPHFFFNSEVLQRANNIRMDNSLGIKKTDSGVDTYVITANYSNWYIRHDNDDEWKVNYLTEDIGWNSFYFLARHEYAFWMGSEEFGLPKNKRGEFYFFLHKQLMSRYYMERLSNDMGKVEYFDWNKPFMTGYYPTMSFHNGLPFPERKRWSEFPTYKWKYIDEIKLYEARIKFAIDSGYIYGKGNAMPVDIYSPEGYEYLGNIVEGNADSYNKRLYGSVGALARNILGFNVEPSNKYHVIPSALEMFSTGLRDPAFYRICKRILGFSYRYKWRLPVYTRDELLMPGVEIESFNVDKLITYFDYFDANINNALMIESEEEAEKYVVKARQLRLNHKPYTFHLTIKSDKAAKGVIRVFLGPKNDEYNQKLSIDENWKYFFELDQWIVDLKPGENKFERSSHLSNYAVADEVPSDLFYKKIEKALESGEKIDYPEQPYGFPDRLVLPKGKAEGMPFQLFAYISQVDDAKLFNVDSPIWGKKVFDGKPMGFPLDRPMYAFNFTVPNMCFKDVFIYHKDFNEINVTV